MKVSELMTKTVAFCGPDTNLAEAAATMWEKDCGFLPVVAHDGKLTGVITDRDICIALGTRNQRPSDVTVGVVASGQSLTCRPNDDVQAAIHLMRRERIRRLPVVNEHGGLAGVLSLNDIALNARAGDSQASRALSMEEVASALRAVCERSPASVAVRSAAAGGE